jgi:hypothetical protein
MIIPTPEFDPFFADDGTPFQQKMLDLIHREFADLLAADQALLRQVQQIRSKALLAHPRWESRREKSAA